MRITVLTVGSRGDVQPYLALGAGLRAAGHDVRLATHARFRDTIEERGLAFRPLEGDPRELIRGRAGAEWLASGESTIRFAHRFLRLFRPLLRPYLDDVQAACAGSDAIVFAPLAFAAWHVAEALGVPSWMAAVQPATRTRAFPALPAAARESPGGAYNLATHILTEQLVWQALRPALNAWRRESLALRPLPLRGPFRLMQTRRTPVLYGFSPLVLPKPTDWPPWYQLTGYWFLDRPAGWSPPPRVARFLASGPPPVYVGFGSMVPRDPAATTDLVLGALRRAGVRGILATGWMGETTVSLPDQVLAVDDIPHDWLFPRVAAVVHHGGAGTTAAAMRAGRPAVVVPFFADQPFWAGRVAGLGVGPPPIPHRRLTLDRLAWAIRIAVRDDAVARRALALGDRLRAEDGVARAVEAITHGGWTDARPRSFACMTHH
ncbi:MAG: glycosyltransferase [Gemmatimonadota bacterium]|nr:glycosyltransferase [Gemmatimonadota bacterium]MDH4350400.1 glycosyltransferase [Gemmatimonadota bacterium]MDH5199128.1 glycosyltransferase [Gemmatimonadota bacterium]